MQPNCKQITIKKPCITCTKNAYAGDQRQIPIIAGALRFE